MAILKQTARRMYAVAVIKYAAAAAHEWEDYENRAKKKIRQDAEDKEEIEDKLSRKATRKKIIHPSDDEAAEHRKKGDLVFYRTAFLVPSNPSNTQCP